MVHETKFDHNTLCFTLYGVVTEELLTSCRKQIDFNFSNLFETLEVKYTCSAISVQRDLANIPLYSEQEAIPYLASIKGTTFM